jgi:hypothetical protein
MLGQKFLTLLLLHLDDITLLGSSLNSSQVNRLPLNLTLPSSFIQSTVGLEEGLEVGLALAQSGLQVAGHSTVTLLILH